MKIALSKKDDPRGLHAVLVCETKNEAAQINGVLINDILENKANPVRELLDDGRVVFRFNLKYLDRLGLAFPMAELSKGIHKRLRRAEEIRLEGIEVPEINVPKWDGNLYDFQKIAAGLIIDGEIDFLNMEMGLGKTYATLAAMRLLGVGTKKRPALVICPNNAKYTWLEVAEAFHFDAVVIDASSQSKVTRELLIEERHGITIVNVEAVRARPVRESKYAPVTGWEYSHESLFDFPYAFAVVDEHHRFKTPTAQATYGFFQLLAEQWIMLSGTPILNRIEEIWTCLHKIYPEEFPDYTHFVNTIGVKAKDTDTIVAYKPGPMAELRDFIRGISFRVRKDQVLKDLPEVVLVPRYVELTPEQDVIYTAIEEELELLLDDGTVKNIGGALPQILRMKQACLSPELFGGSAHSAKIEELKNIVSELVANGEKAIIFSQWSTATRIIQRELSEYNPAYVTGEIKSMKARQAEIKRFMEDDTCHLYIGTIDANREAVNLGIASYVIFTDKGWTPAGQDQAIGRSAAGGLRGLDIAKGLKVHVIELRTRGTVEEKIERLLDRKKAIFDRMVERDGGKQIQKITADDIRSLLRGNGKKKGKKKVSTRPPKESKAKTKKKVKA
jgi:SNF2 family DNA or RNA helicase